MAIDLSSKQNRQKVFFIGIGGIGVSALARKYLSDGWQVVGSDRAPSPITAKLKKLGVKIFFKQKMGNITADIDLVIYTIAIPDYHPELVRARRLGIKVLSYPEALGELSRKVFTVAVSGTHGKTTTAAMTAEILLAARRDPMVIIGSLLRRLGKRQSNFIAGGGPLVVEACEYRRSFLNLSPRILVITNIDTDHLDYYRDLADIQSAFVSLAAKLPADGRLICDKRDPRLKPVLLNTRCLTIDYRRFTAAANRLKLRVSGAHNRLNAAAALAAGKALGISLPTSVGALNKFNGIWRRLEYLGRTRRGTRLYDDYAHHPTEIRATLAAVRRDLKPRRLIAVFQPHLYSRTKLLFDDLAASLTAADEVLLLPIYAAREKPDQTINSRRLAAAVDQAGTPTRYFGSFQTAEKYLKQRLGQGDLLLTMGAGDIYVLAQALSIKK